MKQESDDRILAKEIVRLLMRRSARHPYHCSSNKTAKQFEKIYQDSLTRVTHLETLYEGKKLIAYFFIEKRKAFYQESQLIDYWYFDIDFKSRKAKLWLKKIIQSHLYLINKNTEMRFPVQYIQYLNLFLKSGMSISSIGWVGEIKHAIKVIQDQLKKRNSTLPKGISIEPFRNRSQVPRMINLWKEEFQKRPEHCHFGAYPDLLKREKKRYYAYLKKPSYPFFIIRKNRKISGIAMGSYGLGFGMFGRCSALGFVFSEEIQNRGILRHVYLKIFKQLQKNRYQYYAGDTSHPAVLKLGKQLGRKPSSIYLRYGKGYYPTHYFTRYLKKN